MTDMSSLASLKRQSVSGAMIIAFGNFTGLLDYVGISVIGGVALVAAGYYLAR